jgi:DNA-binding Lrp family transcriptional regulator
MQAVFVFGTGASETICRASEHLVRLRRRQQDGRIRGFKITTEKLTAEEKRSVSGRAHMGFLTTSGKIVIDSGTEQSKPFVMPIGYATCSVYGMSAEAREKNKRLPDYVMRVRWVSKDYRFTGDYNDYPTVD